MGLVCRSGHWRVLNSPRETRVINSPAFKAAFRSSSWTGSWGGMWASTVIPSWSANDCLSTALYTVQCWKAYIIHIVMIKAFDSICCVSLWLWLTDRSPPLTLQIAFILFDNVFIQNLFNKSVFYENI